MRGSFRSVSNAITRGKGCLGGEGRLRHLCETSCVKGCQFFNETPAGELVVKYRFLPEFRLPHRHLDDGTFYRIYRGEKERSGSQRHCDTRAPCLLADCECCRSGRGPRNVSSSSVMTWWTSRNYPTEVSRRAVGVPSSAALPNTARYIMN